MFQPIVDLWSGLIVGHEALSRFPDPADPELWFAAAHRTGQNSDLELVAIRAALAFPPVSEPGAYLSINVCHLLVEEQDLTFLADPVYPRVVLELTEHERVEDYERLAERLQPLRARGVRLSVDDVGSGYASFRHVLELAPDHIKLDRSITEGVDSPAGEGHRALIASLAGFAARVACMLVAEGVETAEEAAALRTLGVRYGQGWHFGPPVAPTSPVRFAPAAAVPLGN